MSRSALILSSSLGSETFYGSNRSIPASSGYTKGRVDGTESYYVVYREPEFDDIHDHGPNSYKIVESTTDMNFGWCVRSLQGFDNTGIALFEHHYFCGTAQNYTTSAENITSAFPAGDRGASAMIVSKGVWSIYTGKNYTGTKIAVGGRDEFGPGTRLQSLGPAEDRVQSVKYIREN